MDGAKIAAGDVLKFLGKPTYPEKCPFTAGFMNKFSLPNATKNFLMPTLKSHMRLLPDYRVFRVTVRATEIYKKIVCVNSPHFLAIFQTKKFGIRIF